MSVMYYTAEQLALIARVCGADLADLEGISSANVNALRAAYPDAEHAVGKDAVSQGAIESALAAIRMHELDMADAMEALSLASMLAYNCRYNRDYAVPHQVEFLARILEATVASQVVVMEHGIGALVTLVRSTELPAPERS